MNGDAFHLRWIKARANETYSMALGSASFWQENAAWACARYRSTEMLRRPGFYSSLVILIALAAFSLVNGHVAEGAKLIVENAVEGHRLADAWCKPCHAVEPHTVGQLDQAPSFEAIANRHGTTALSLKVFLKSNHENMPNLIIAPDQADALVSYILSLKTN